MITGKLKRVIFLYNSYFKGSIIVSVIDFSMLRYIDNEIMLFAKSLPLDRINQKAIAICDIIADHQTDSLLENYLSQPHVRINSNSTVNYVYTQMLKGDFDELYSTNWKFRSHWTTTTPGMRHVDSKKSTLEPMHANWVINTNNLILYAQN